MLGRVVKCLFAPEEATYMFAEGWPHLRFWLWKPRRSIPLHADQLWALLVLEGLVVLMVYVWTSRSCRLCLPDAGGAGCPSAWPSCTSALVSVSNTGLSLLLSHERLRQI